MNGKKTKLLRERAKKLYSNMKEAVKKRVTERKVYQYLKKQYKLGNKEARI